MQFTFSTILSTATLLATANAHGLLSQPPPRQAGQAMGAACGTQALSQQTSDKYGNLQGIMQVANAQNGYDPTKCNLNLCKGYQFEDNQQNIQTYTAGQVVPMKFDLHAPHTGVANVSVVDTATNKPIGQPLKSWTNYASNSGNAPADQLDFSVTMPDLGSKCATAGACVLQHWWDAANINQTYESCVDFTMNGSGGSSSPAPAAPSSVSAAAAVSTSAPASGSGSKPTTLVTSVKPTSTASPSTTPAAGGDDEEECEDEPADSTTAPADEEEEDC